MKIIDGKPEYRNALDVFVRVVRKEGFFSLWKGCADLISCFPLIRKHLQLHTLLHASWPAHSAHIHFPRADEQRILRLPRHGTQGSALKEPHY